MMRICYFRMYYEGKPPICSRNNKPCIIKRDEDVENCPKFVEMDMEGNPINYFKPRIRSK